MSRSDDDRALSATVDAPLRVPISTAHLIDVADTADIGARRYAERSLLGAGGMGEVRLVRDEHIGRDVAMKVMRTGSSDPLRFLREARVQGQLEHPSIVPVYDLARGDDNEIFFTMKRVRGVTLEQVVANIAAGDPGARSTFSRHKLLSAFVSVCLAVDFAHSRGVVHRDLKPSNIMLGDFGEVYVLDWGIAKLLHDEEPERVGPTAQFPSAPTSQRYQTEGGVVLGTAGYMSPEQVRCTPLDARSDVYALGAILFEVVTGEPLHTGTAIVEIAESTLRSTAERVRSVCRAHEVPPELEAICVNATALDTAERTPSARLVSNAIERYLDGDRDVERRRELARGHAAAARIAMTSALGGDDGARGSAMLEAGRALALDPECAEASYTVMKLMTTLPAQVPREVEDEMEANRLRAAPVAGIAGVGGFASILVMVPLVAWMGVRDWRALAIGMLAIACGAACALASGRWPRRGRTIMFFTYICGAVLLAVIARLFGPFFTVPAVALGVAIAGGFHPMVPRWWSVAFACLGMLAPFALELGGVLTPSCHFEHGTIVVEPVLAALPPIPTLTYLVSSSLAVVLSVSAYVLVVRRRLDAAQRTILLRSWQLRQLVPKEIGRNPAAD